MVIVNLAAANSAKSTTPPNTRSTRPGRNVRLTLSRDWPFGTRIVLDGEVWTCVDRGSAIGYDRRGLPIIDFMTDAPGYTFKQSVTVQVLPPLEVTQAALDAMNAELKEKMY